jgi:hypothetical protein
MGVSVQNSIPQLKNGIKIHKTAVKGSMNYYHVKAVDRADILVTLNVEGMGDSDLYANPGKFNFPTSSKYYRKSNGMSDDEITFTQEDHDKNFPDKKSEVWYTIGVYTFSACDFDLLSLQNKFKIVKAYSSQLYTLTTSKTDPVVFEFPSSSYTLEKLIFQFWSDTSNLEVFVSKYSKDDDYNASNDEIDNPLLRNIPSFSNNLYSFKSSVLGKVTRSSIPVDNKGRRVSYLVALYPIGEEKAKISFFRYDNETEMKLGNHSTVKEKL